MGFKGMKCILCGGGDLRALPAPAEGRSITTAGVVINETLRREQCMSCALLQKSGRKFVGYDDFYEQKYENYYERPGVRKYDWSRYLAMAQWLKATLGDFAPRRILDVGCGAGWSMAASTECYPHAAIEGVEPSAVNADKARHAGFIVYSGRLNADNVPATAYDLIYANNVLQHVVDPLEFLRGISRLLAPGGRVVFILPDAAEPSHELLWCDHNFSFRATDLALLGKAAGFRLVTWQANPANDTLLNKQLIVLAKDDTREATVVPDGSGSIDALFGRRAEYFERWRSLDEVLQQRTAGFRRVFNFGGSMWTWLLAGYCPRYWSAVEACLVDGEHGQSIDKKVVPPSEISFERGDCIVLGVNPSNQAAFVKRLHGAGAQLITWSDWIKA